MSVATAVSTPPKKLGMFQGVFLPTFLSIMGIVFFLRLGFVVGSGGLLATIAIILLSVSVTITTGLSLSALTTTLRIGEGGAYSIVSKTLGLEVGGSVGIPLFLAQILSVVFYVFGFTEAWLFIFPDHLPLLVSFGAFVALFSLSFFSLQFAVRTQFLVFLVTIATLLSIFSGGGTWWLNPQQTPFLMEFSQVPFWALFALFFPAVTGLTSGIGLSGDLSDPKRQIPRGLMMAILLTTFLYIFMAVWLSYQATPEELIGEKLIIVRLAAYGPLVLAGILSASFTSALTRFVTAPRLLRSLCEHRIFPFCETLSKSATNGEPRRATLFCSVLIFSALFIGSLDLVAPILTMFFLITYAVINIAVFIELSLGLVSFRPTIKIPKIVPLYGAISSIVFMFLIHVVAGIIALAFLFGIYIWLVHKDLEQKEGDVRSGLFRSLSEWAAKKAQTLPESDQHTWKPNILLPALDSATVFGNFPLIRAIAYPNGTMTVLGMKVTEKDTEPDGDEKSGKGGDEVDDLQDLPTIVKKFGEEGIFTSFSIIEVDDYSKGICVALEAIDSQVFHSNIIFLPFKPDQFTKTALARIFAAAEGNKESVVLFNRDEEMGLGSQKDIHVWLDPDVLDQDFYEDRKFDLSLLIGYKLQQNWKGIMHIWMCVPEEKKQTAESYLRKLVYEARLPASTQTNVEVGSFINILKKSPQGDVHILAATADNLDDISRISRIEGRSFLFVSDSTKEDILA